MSTKERPVTTRTPTETERRTLAELEQAEADAMTQVAEARTAAQALRDAEHQRRQEAQEVYDREFLAAWQDNRRRLEQEIGEARTALREAVMADPVWSAYRQQVLAQHRLRTLWTDTSSTNARITGRGEFGPAPAIDELTFDVLARLVSLDAVMEGRDEQQARVEARENAGTQP